MSVIDPRIRLHPTALDEGFWLLLARTALDWLRMHALPVRDSILLLPSADLLPLARRAFAAEGGWQPRIETWQTLAASLAPPREPGSGGPSLDPAIDRLAAAGLLRSQAAGAAWARRDPRGFEQAVAALADTAQALARANFDRAPAKREAAWQAARDLMLPVAGPGATERMLARIALEWAATSEAPAGDAVFKLRPAAWVALQAGGASPAIAALFAAADAPKLLLDADPPADAVFAAPSAAPPTPLVCENFEAEAQAAAAQVLQAIAAGKAPVLLVAQDRLLVRRVRALLERADVRLRDETGWKLSTTRAAARVMGLLRACASGATADAALDWLKGDGLGSAHPQALQALEAQWRRGREPGDAAQALWAHARARLEPLANAPRQALSAWLLLLQRALQDDARLAADDAGRQVLATLRLDGRTRSPAWQAVAADTRFDLEDFMQWVDATLESAHYLPPADDDAEVIVTPLARAVLRPFAAAVFPGTDHDRLGAASAPHPLLSEAMAAALGLDTNAGRREREALGLAHVLRLPAVTLLRRISEGSESLARSPLVERAMLAARRAGTPWPPEVPAPVLLATVTRRPMARPAPAAAAALPGRLSASAVEALRECPYRFFARSVLRLQDPAELDAELEKRDYGSWLHAVLMRFHTGRTRPLAIDEEVARLHAVADEVQAQMRLDAAQLLPFRAGFASLAPLYAAWLHARDVAGWAFEDGEIAARAEPDALAGTVLDGRIDRIDEGPAGVQLVDYKTGSVDDLRRRVRDPLEDTQLPFYAALMAHKQATGRSRVCLTPSGGPTQSGRFGGAYPRKPLHAIYLALDDRKGPLEVPHPEVAESAAVLVEGLAQDLERLRAGAGLPALGEGRVCETCEARGLCRRDHWTGPG